LAGIYKPDYALDFGSGGGALLRGMQARGVAVVGLEGSQWAVDLWPDVIHLWDLREPYYAQPAADLVTCFDVGEHLPAEAGPVLVQSMVDSVAEDGTILFGAAPPGQDGLGHIYWIDLFERAGSKLIAEESEELRALIESHTATNTVWWVAKNLMVFQ
jgi:hypothetical protein